MGVTGFGTFSSAPLDLQSSCFPLSDWRVMAEVRNLEGTFGPRSLSLFVCLFPMILKCTMSSVSVRHYIDPKQFLRNHLNL